MTVQSTAGPSKVEATALMIALLAALMAIGQFATNVYLPSLPAIRDEFLSNDTMAQLTLTTYLIGFAVMQLVYGPISDRYGRRPLLIYGIAVFMLGSAVCVLAPSMQMLIAGRITQAVGAAASLVVARAVVRDSFDGDQLQRVMALVSVFFALVPGLSPFIGGIVEQYAGWRWIFVLTGGAGVIVLVWMYRKIPETLHTPLPRLDMASVFAGYGMILRSAHFRRYAFANAFIFAAMFAFFGGSPKLYIDVLGVTPTEFGFYPPLASIGFVIGGITVSRLTGKVSSVGICKLGLVVLIAGPVISVVLPLLDIVHKHGFNLAVIIFVTGLGIFLPTAMATALQAFPERAGSASAMLGFLQMAGAAAGSALVGLYQEQEPVLTYPLVMLAATLMAAAVFMLEGRERATPT
ncbi:MAG: multidrug effflux MFS transporter [Minwuia sp.]|nr:multidrug effflux MFS transporter [Minwuia sp.]